MKITHKKNGWDFRSLNDNLLIKDVFPAGTHLTGFIGEGTKVTRVSRRK